MLLNNLAVLLNTQHTYFPHIYIENVLLQEYPFDPTNGRRCFGPMQYKEI